MLHDESKCNANFDLVNEGNSDALVEVVLIEIKSRPPALDPNLVEPHPALDPNLVIHKSEFHITAHTTENNTMSFFYLICDKNNIDVQINLIDKE